MDHPPLRPIVGQFITGGDNETDTIIGQLVSQQMEISGLKSKMDENANQVRALQRVVRKLNSKINPPPKKVKEDLRRLMQPDLAPSIIIPKRFIESRTKLPSNNISERTKIRRRLETIALCDSLHGGTEKNNLPTVIGMLDTLAAKISCKKLAQDILQTRPNLTNSIMSLCMRKIERRKKHYHNSSENILRSLNVYYSYNVMGKQKYLALRSANRISGLHNFVDYRKLSNHIRSIDIGNLHDARTLIPDASLVDPNEDITGVYRDLTEYALYLAKFYLSVNVGRKDKLNTFPDLPRKNASSYLFLMAIGGDYAPLVGTSFLLSFLNIGKRTASSFENFLIFGSNAKENSQIVRLYIKKLLSDIRFLENQVFTFELNGQKHHVEFKLKLLPNDMKMLSFLAGELSNASTYFTTFANVSKNDASDLSKKFAMDGTQFWKPWNNEDRNLAAAKVELKKEELRLKSSKSRRSLITQFISSELKCRQESRPLLEEYINLAKCEPLHLKNNVVKELFSKLLEEVISEVNLPERVSNFKQIPDGNIFKEFVYYIKVEMKCNQLAQRLISWFNENHSNLLASTSSFDFRFRGHESLGYLMSFPLLISMLIKASVISTNHHMLYTIFYRSLALRNLISLSTRITDVNRDKIKEMYVEGRKLFCATVLCDGTVSPSMWVLCNVAPCHASQIYEEIGYGLGINTMEGREQKHQQILKYSQNTQFQDRWSQIFRHEYIQVVYLRKNGFDLKKYKKPIRSYYPESEENLCGCSLPLVNQNCDLCSSPTMMVISQKVQSVL